MRTPGIGSAALAAALWLAAAGCSPAPPRAEGPVDVVVYVVDTLRRDRLGVYGYRRPTSPHLDALAAESFVFDEAHAPAPWTIPSVVSLLTSVQPVDHRVERVGMAIPPALATLPLRLRELGHRTAGHSANPLVGRSSGVDRQFETFRRLRRTTSVAAIEHWIDGVGDAPFFLYVHTTEPHAPYEPPDEFLERFGPPPPGAKDELAEAARTWYARWGVVGAPPPRYPNPELIDLAYDATVAWADARLGKLVQALKRRGRWERTLFVFVADHGEELQERGSFGHGQSLHAEQIRVPMLWRLPNLDGRGQRITAPASLVDVMPTVLDYLGRADLARGCQGRSLLGALAEPRKPPRAETVVTSMRFRAGDPSGPPLGELEELSLAAGRWKAIVEQPSGELELYDTERDPTERTDLAAREPERAGRLRAAAERWLAERPAIAGVEPVAGPEVDEETREQMRALGYAPP
jgi:arylsulfatase A-like enzyme